MPRRRPRSRWSAHASARPRGGPATSVRRRGRDGARRRVRCSNVSTRCSSRPPPARSGLSRRRSFSTSRVSLVGFPACIPTPSSSASILDLLDRHERYLATGPAHHARDQRGSISSWLLPPSPVCPTIHCRHRAHARELPKARNAARDPTARPAPHPRHAGFAGRHPPEGRLRASRPSHRLDHRRTCSARRPGHAGGGGGEDRGSGVFLANRGAAMGFAPQDLGT